MAASFPDVAAHPKWMAPGIEWRSSTMLGRSKLSFEPGTERCRLYKGRIMVNPAFVLAAGAQLLSGGGADAWDLRCHSRFY